MVMDCNILEHCSRRLDGDAACSRPEQVERRLAGQGRPLTQDFPVAAAEECCAQVVVAVEVLQCGGTAVCGPHGMNKTSRGVEGMHFELLGIVQPAAIAAAGDQLGKGPQCA